MEPPQNPPSSGGGDVGWETQRHPDSLPPWACFPQMGALGGGFRHPGHWVSPHDWGLQHPMAGLHISGGWTSETQTLQIWPGEVLFLLTDTCLQVLLGWERRGAPWGLFGKGTNLLYGAPSS